MQSPSQHLALIELPSVHPTQCGCPAPRDSVSVVGVSLVPGVGLGCKVSEGLLLEEGLREGERCGLSRSC